MKARLAVSLVALVAAAQELSQQGAEAMREGRFAEAERIYRQMLKESPDDARLHMNLGLALQSARKYREAIPELERYLKDYPHPGPVHLVVGAARLKLNEYCEAIEALEKARQWQASTEVLIELGDAYSGCGRHLNAARAYREAARLSPTDLRLARASARSYWQARRYDEARTLFASIESHYATDPEFLYEYGDTLTRLEGAEAGLPHLVRAVQAAPDLIPARGVLGRALMELGQADKSIPHLEAAAPADPTLLLPLSRAYKAVGRVEDAARAQAEYRRKLAGQNPH